MLRANRVEAFRGSSRIHRDRCDIGVVRSIACAAIGALLGWVGGCAPAADQGCGADNDCQGRGQMCDVDVGECVDKVIDTSSTENPAQADFTGKAVPFHRGTVCFTPSVQAGQKTPVALIPCLHPCLTTTTHHHKNYYSCVGSSCEAWATVYFDASGAACPPDAFGGFAKEMCVFPEPVNLNIGSTIGDGNPVQGTMTLEVPFLTNEDAAIIAAASDDTELMKMRIEQYPQQDSRIVGDIDLKSGNPVPPETCMGETNCTCVEIGF